MWLRATRLLPPAFIESPPGLAPSPLGDLGVARDAHLLTTTSPSGSKAKQSCTEGHEISQIWPSASTWTGVDHAPPLSVNSSPFPSPATQKPEDGHDTVFSGFSSTVRADHEEPSKANTLPSWSTATQKVGVAHDTELG